jgi:hypothetical protein
MPQTVTAPAATAHPILVEVTETRLVWIEADTPEQARAAADESASSGEASGTLVDWNIETRVATEPGSYWFHAASEDFERLDAYFAAHTAR